MKNQAQAALKRSRRTAIRAAFTVSSKAVSVFPGGNSRLANLFAESVRTEPSEAEVALTGKTAPGTTGPGRKARIFFRNYPGAGEVLLRSAESGGVEEPAVLEQLAAHCSRQGEHELSVSLRRRALRVEEKKAHRHLALAWSLAELDEQNQEGDPLLGPGRHASSAYAGEALKEFRRTLELAPGSALALHELGTHLVKMGRSKEGIAQLEAAVAKEPHASWLCDLGDAYSAPAVARHSRAFSAYERALQSAPEDRRSLQGMLLSGPPGTRDWSRIWKGARQLERPKSSPYSNPRLKEFIDTLFTSDIGEKKAQALLQGLREMAVGGRHLHPSTQHLVATRLQVLGYISDGFALYAGLADQRVQQMLNGSSESISRLQSAMQAVVYQGDYDQATLLSDPQLWEDRGADVQRQAAKLHADAELLKGNLGPYIKASRAARSDAGLAQDSRMSSLVRGRKVALVGSAVPQEELGQLIDSYDVVVRVGYDQEEVAQNQAALGRRTDILYCSPEELRRSSKSLAADVERGNLSLVVAPARGLTASQRESEWLRPADREFSLQFHGEPLALQRAVYDLLQFKPAEICLLNTDLFLSSFAEGYRERREPAAPGTLLNTLLIQRDLKFGFTFLKTLWTAGKIVASGRAREVLALSPDEFVQALESEVAAGKAERAGQRGGPKHEVEPREAQVHLNRARDLLKLRTEGIITDPVLGLARGDMPSHEDKALEELHKALTFAPGDPVLLFEVGRLLFEKGEVDEGIAHLEAAVAKNPRGVWFRELGAAYRRPHVAQFEKALSAYERAFRKNQKDTRALSGILNIGVRGTLDWPRLWQSARQLELKDSSSPYHDAEFQAVLDGLFDQAADAQDVEAALRVISSSEVRGQELHSAVLGFVATRIQFMGHLGAGYELRAKLAQKRSALAAKDVNGLRQLMRALVYLDDYEQATLLSQPRFWPQEDLVLRQKHEKIHAEAQLMLGQAEPYIAYSEKVREAYPLPVDQTMESMIRGKRVAIVGPVDTGDRLGSLIDEFDVIVRPRFAPDFVAQHTESMGSRTDIVYINGQDIEKDIPPMGEAVGRGELRLAVARPLSYHQHQGRELSWLRFYRQDFGLHFHGFALGVQRFAYDILQFAPAEIGIFNTDMYTGTDAFAAGYRDAKDIGFGPGSIMNDLIVNHDLLFDFKYMKSLESTGLLKTYGKAAEVLRMTPEEYVHALETGGALTT